MGYESKIYVVKKSNFSCREDGKVYAEVIAMVDMCKCYDISDILRNKPATDCYIYAEDHDTQVVEDRYGEPLTEAPLCEAIKIVERAMQKDDYWRYNILLSTLKAFEIYDCMNIAVLHYGY